MKITFAVGALALFVPLARAQDAPLLSISKIPPRASAVSRFAPRGWKTEKLVRGDLNRDGRSDAAIVLVENKPAQDKNGAATPRQRALVVALNAKNGWKRVGSSNQLLLGTRDGGAFYGMMETPVDVSIMRGVIVVEMESGSREVQTTTHRLRYEPQHGGVFLIGLDSVVHDRLSGLTTKTSANYLTGIQYAKSITNSKTTGNTTRVSRTLRPLESLRSDER